MNIDETIREAKVSAVLNETEAQRCIQHGGSWYEEKAKAHKVVAEESAQIAEWLEELKAYRETQGWIPCNERVPKWKDHTDDMVLVCYADGSVRFNTFMNWQWVQGEPIAWMPLPKPWKGADDGDQ